MVFRGLVLVVRVFCFPTTVQNTQIWSSLDMLGGPGGRGKGKVRLWAEKRALRNKIGLKNICSGLKSIGSKWPLTQNLV